MVSGETVCVCDVVTWCDREGSRGKGNSGKENGKGGFVGMGGEGHWEGASGNQTGAGGGIVAREFANVRALAGGDNGWGALS